MSISVRFVDASEWDRSVDSLYARLIAEAAGEPVTIVSDAKAHVDLELVSVHASEFKRLARTALSVSLGNSYRRRLRRAERWNNIYREPSSRARRSVWFTGDNIRPPGGAWDGYLSFDLDPLDGRNAYFPHWWQYTGILDSKRLSYSGLDLDIESLTEAREPDLDRPEFACAFIGNPTPVRLHAIDALSKVGRVDVYGNSVGKPVPSKVSVAKRYRYVMCFENDLYPGYTTEKPFEAWATGAIPLWWGLDPAGYVNPRAVIDAAECESLSAFASAVARLEADDSARAAMAASPILLRPPDLGPALTLLRAVLGVSD
jgi:hypothetical protein